MSAPAAASALATIRPTASQTEMVSVLRGIAMGGTARVRKCEDAAINGTAYRRLCGAARTAWGIGGYRVSSRGGILEAARVPGRDPS